MDSLAMVSHSNFCQMLTYINVSAEFVGIDPSFAVYLVSISNAGSAAGRVLTGVLADRYGATMMRSS